MGKAYAADSQKAKEHVYLSLGGGECPYDEGTRPARLWYKWLAYYRRMESQFDELAMAYGEFRPDRMKDKETDR